MWSDKGWIAPEPDAGFTLLELLVALTILALLVTLLSGGLRFGTRVWQTGQISSDELSTMEATEGLLRRVIASAPAAAQRTPGAAQTNLFRGSADSMRFVGPAPALAMPEGLYEITLAIRNGKLLLTWNAFRSDLGTLSKRAGEQVLVSGLSDAAFAYRSPGSATWASSWSTPTSSPALVMIRLGRANDARRWPDLVVAPRLTAAGMHVAVPRDPRSAD